MNTQRRHKKPDPAVMGVVQTPYMTIVECLQCIVDHGKHSKALNYCVNYAKYGIEIYGRNGTQPHLTREELVKYCKEMHTQLLYVLNNMTHWRGETASNVRVNLRKNVRNLEDAITQLRWKETEGTPT